jgi:hypothetical protein
MTGRGARRTLAGKAKSLRVIVASGLSQATFWFWISFLSCAAPLLPVGPGLLVQLEVGLGESGGLEPFLACADGAGLRRWWHDAGARDLGVAANPARKWLVRADVRFAMDTRVRDEPAGP